MSDAKLWYRNVYLHSDLWKSIRAEVLERFEGACTICQAFDISNDVHHLWYDDCRFFVPEQFVLLCRSCHEFIHNNMKVVRCVTPKQQRAAIKRFNKVRSISQKPKPVQINRFKPKTNIPYCKCCYSVDIALHPYNVGRNKRQEDGGDQFLICEKCEMLVIKILDALETDKPTKRWEAVKAMMQEKRNELLMFDKLKSMSNVLPEELMNDLGSGI